MVWSLLNKPDISSKAKRRNLPWRHYAHWYFFSYSRHLGYLQRANKATYWVARARVRGGTYIQHRIGKTDDLRPADGKTFFTFEQAREIAYCWFKSCAARESFADPKQFLEPDQLIYSPVGDIYTIGHALRDYLEWKKLVAAKSYIATITNLINFHILPILGPLRADDFNGEHLKDFVRQVMETPARHRSTKVKRVAIASLSEEALRKRRGTVNTLIGFLKAALQNAWENGKIDNNRGWHTLKRIRNVSRARIIYLNRAECRALVAHCKPDLARLVLGALYTGCRVSELLRMEAGDVGRDGYGVHIKPLKTYKPRFVFLPDEGMTFFLMLAKGKSPNELLFCRDDGSEWRRHHRYQFTQTVIEAKLPQGFRFHGLRHTYASQLVQAGAPLMVVAEQLGHSNTMCVAETYGHLSPQIREAEVRQRYTSVDREMASVAVTQKKALMRWRKSLHGGNWRNYAEITDLSARDRTK